MNFAAYRAEPGVNWSTLKAMRDSPRAYLHAIKTERKDTLPMMLGRAVHTLVLEPATFGELYATWTGGDRRGAKWTEFEAEHEGMTIFKPAEVDLAHAMAEAVLADPVARECLHGASYEQSVRWTDPATGLACKGRPDVLNKGRLLLADLKTCRSIDARRFGNESARLAYPQQLAHYHSGCLHGLGWAPQVHALIAVENAAPHDVGVFEIPPANREIAAEEVAALLLQLRECMAADKWPGRYQAVQLLQLPAYIEGEMEFENE